jgi:hypothetical protein
MKKLLAVAALALFTLTVVSAKTYNITLVNPTKAGAVQLQPGQYKLEVKDGNAIFTDGANSRKTFTTPVKVQEADKKYDDTRVISSKDGEFDKINEIDLGGSKTKLGF